MNRNEFLTELANQLISVEQVERAKAIEYYRDYIDDAVEAGKTETEVIALLESPSQIAMRIRSEFAMSVARKSPTPKNSWKAVWAVLGVCSLPITLPIAIGIIAMCFGLAVTVAAIAFSLIAMVATLIVLAIILGVSGIMQIVSGAATSSAILMLGMGIVGFGLSVLALIGVIYMIRGLTKLMIMFFHWIFKKAGGKKI